MKSILGASGLCVIMLLCSCGKEVIHGRGAKVSQPRNLANFSSVHINGDFSVHIRQGNSQTVQVNTYENIVNIVETQVVNGKLVIEYDNNYINIRNSNTVVDITVPTLIYAKVNGSGNISIDGFTNGNMLDANVNGSGDVHITNSNYNRAVFDVNGSGNIRAAGLQVNDAEAIIHGSGGIETTCRQNLKARISGSGSIRYWGNPILDVQVSGSGGVIKQ